MSTGFGTDKALALGFGTYKLDEKTCYHMCLEALKLGYRHLDTAQLYKNELAVAQAICDSKVPREEIFLTTKIHWKHIKKGREALLEVIDQQIKIFGLIDLLLLHRPTSNYQEAWHVLTHDLNHDTVRHVGVSNFALCQLKALDPPPFAHQFQLRPDLPQTEMLTYCRKQGIVTVAYANHGNQTHGLPVQEWIRWVRDQECIPLCQTSSTTHLYENFQA